LPDTNTCPDIPPGLVEWLAAASESLRPTADPRAPRDEVCNKFFYQAGFAEAVFRLRLEQRTQQNRRKEKPLG
jgi:hypothetical protein